MTAEPARDVTTPPQIEAELYRLTDQSDAARKEFAKLRNAEVAAELAYQKAHRRAEASPDAPKVGVFGGVRTTVNMRRCWVEEQTTDEYETWQWAKAARQDAGTHLHTLGQQISALQTISKSVGQAYQGTGRGNW